MVSVRLLTRLGALFALVLFGLASEHCQLEAMPLFKVLQCCCDEEKQVPVPADCGDSVCTSVESGHFRLEDQKPLGEVPVLDLVFEYPLLDCHASPEAFRFAAGEPELAPPELIVGWQFACRAAVSPRAPSFIS